MIKSIHLKPFGHFENRKFYFTSGINLIYAGNEEGKTTLLASLQAALLGFIPAGKNYKYFPWQADRLYLEASLRDGRLVSREINSSIKGFIKEDGRLEAIVNRPLDNISRYYLENFHILEAENIYRLSQDSMDEIIEDHLERLYQGQGSSYRDMLRLLDERKKEIYKKRGSNFLLAQLDERIYEERKNLLARQKAQEAYREKNGELASLDMNEESSTSFKEELDNLDRQIEAQTGELLELRRLNELESNLQEVKSWTLGLLPLLAAALVYFFVPNLLWPVIVLALGLSLLYLWINRGKKTYNKTLLEEAGFYNLEDFKESLELQRSMDFGLEDLLKEKSRLESQEEKTLLLENKEREERIINLRVELARLEEILAGDDGDLQQLEEKRKELLDDYNRYASLEALLETSYESFKDEFLPELLDRASSYLFAFSQGKYKKILLDQQGSFYLQAQTGHLEFSPSMSKGLRSQFYLALRLAFIDKLAPELPIFYDEAFSNWDEPRLVASLKRLQELPRQQFIFTCREAEASLYEEILAIKRIEL